MSASGDARHGCSGKVRYTSFTRARKAAARARRNNDENHVGPYHCTICDGFHLGEMLKQAKRTKDHKRRIYEELENAEWA